MIGREFPLTPPRELNVNDNPCVKFRLQDPKQRDEASPPLPHDRCRCSLEPTGDRLRYASVRLEDPDVACDPQITSAPRNEIIRLNPAPGSCPTITRDGTH